MWNVQHTTTSAMRCPFTQLHKDAMLALGPLGAPWRCVLSYWFGSTSLLLDSNIFVRPNSNKSLSSAS